MIKGETVILTVKEKVGIDPLGSPIYSETLEEVKNVLVGTASASPNITETDLNGGRVAFTLGIPKGDNHVWEDTTVYIRGIKFRTYGRQLTQTEENVPGMWNTQVTVERYE